MKDPLAKLRARIERRDWDGAEGLALARLRQAPGDPEAHFLLGVAHLERHRNGEAVAAFHDAMRCRSPYPAAMLNLAVACNRSGEHEIAQQVSELLVQLEPGSAAARLNLGMAFKGQRRLAEARHAFESAGPHPMARFNLGHTLLLEGDLGHGLPLFEERRTVLRTGAGLVGAPWDGAARPADTLLVIPEQGLGDVLLMSRFFVPLLDRFARVIVHSPAPLARLLATLDPRLEVVTSLAGANWDVWAPVMSLPWLMGVRTLEQLPCEPWLRVPEPARAGGRPRVGINWAGNPAYAYDSVRSTPLETFAPLLALAGFEWVSLHRGEREHEAQRFGLAEPLREAADFLDTARAIAGLDLVLSTETAIPNLSAAMGVPTGVLCVRDADWRWRGWYRGVTVCDQDAPNNWYGPIAKAAVLLQQLLAERGAARAA